MGIFVWSPDNQRVAFSRYGISGSDAGYTVGGNALTVLDLTSEEVLKLEVGSHRRIGDPWPCAWTGMAIDFYDG